MSFLRSLALPLTATAAGSAIGFGEALYRVARPSEGPAISAAASKTAVIIIDMQRAFTATDLPPDFDAQVVQPAVGHINDLAHLARRRGWPVLAVRMIMKNPRLRLAMRVVGAPMPKAGSPEVELDPRLELAGAEVFDKEVGDAFASPQFDAFLRQHDVGRVLVTGLDGIACVQRTARGALQRGYDVGLVQQAIISRHVEDWQNWQDKLQDLGARIVQVQDLDD